MRRKKRSISASGLSLPQTVRTGTKEYKDLYNQGKVGTYDMWNDTYHMSLPEFEVKATDQRGAAAVTKAQNAFLRGASQLPAQPVLQMMGKITGKEQFPSEAWGFNNPDSWSWKKPGVIAKDIANFGMDTLLDPTTYLGVGVVNAGLKAGIGKGAYRTLANRAKFVKDVGVDNYLINHARGLTRGAKDIMRGRPVFETFPVTQKHIRNITRKQNEEAVKGMRFVDNWFYSPGKEHMRAIPEQKIQSLFEDVPDIAKGAFDRLNSNKGFDPVVDYFKNVMGLSYNDLKPIVDSKVGLVTRRYSNLVGKKASRTGEFSNAVNVDKVLTNYTAGGFSDLTASKPVAYRNTGLYYHHPSRVKDVVIHELAHESEKFGRVGLPGNFGRRISEYSPKTNYHIPNSSTSAGKSLSEHMISAITPDGKVNRLKSWVSSPSELYAELMTARRKVANELITARRHTPDAFGKDLNQIAEGAIQQLHTPRDFDVKRLIDLGRLDRFFKKGTSFEDKKRIIQMFPAVGGVGLVGGLNGKDKKDVPIMAYGGHINKIGLMRRKSHNIKAIKKLPNGGRIKPINLKGIEVKASRPNVVDSADDPRYKAYQDSLFAYNTPYSMDLDRRRYEKEYYDIIDSAVKGKFNKPYNEYLRDVSDKYTKLLKDPNLTPQQIRDLSKAWGDDTNIQYLLNGNELNALNSLSDVDYNRYDKGTDFPVSIRGIKATGAGFESPGFNRWGDLPTWDKPTNPIFLRGSKEAQQAERDWSKATPISQMKTKGVSSTPNTKKELQARANKYRQSQLPYGEMQWFGNVAGAWGDNRSVLEGKGELRGENYNMNDLQTMNKKDRVALLESTGIYNLPERYERSSDLWQYKKQNMKTRKRIPVMNTGGHLLSAVAPAMQGFQMGAAIHPAVGAVLGAGMGIKSFIDSKKQQDILDSQERRNLDMQKDLRYDSDLFKLNQNKFKGSGSMFNYMPQGGVLNKLNLGNADFGIGGVSQPIGQGEASMVLNNSGGTKGLHETGQNVPVTDNQGQVQAMVEPGEVITDDGYVFSKRLGFADKYNQLQKEKTELEQKLVDGKISQVERNTLKRKHAKVTRDIESLPAQQEAVKDMLGLNEQEQGMQQQPMGDPMGDPMQQGMMDQGMMEEDKAMYGDQGVPMMDDGGFIFNSPYRTPKYRKDMLNSLNRFNSIEDLNIKPSTSGFSFMPGTHIKAGVGNSFSYDPSSFAVPAPGTGRLNNMMGINYGTKMSSEAAKAYSPFASNVTPGINPLTKLDKVSDVVPPKKMDFSNAAGIISTFASNLHTNNMMNKSYKNASKLQYKPQEFIPRSERVEVGDQVSAANMAYADARDNYGGSSAINKNAFTNNLSANRFRGLNEIYGNANRAVSDIRASNIAGLNQTINTNKAAGMAFEQNQAQQYTDLMLGKAAGSNALNTTVLNILREKNMMNLDSEKLASILTAVEDSGVANYADVKAIIEKIMKGQ